MNSSNKVKLFYKRNNEEVDMPDHFDPQEQTTQNATEGDIFIFFGDFYADKSRRNNSKVASTIITYEVQYVGNEETIMTTEIKCDFGNGNTLVLIGNIRAEFFEIKSGKLNPYKTENLTFPNLAIVGGTGDFEHTTGSAKYIINGHQAGVGSLGELDLMINKK